MTSFTLGACQVRLGFSCFALLAFCCLFLGAGGSAFFLAAAACHESAHIAMLFCLGAPPSFVEISALGCRIVPNQEKVLSYRKQALVSLAGPGMNLFLASGLLFPGWGKNVFFSANLILGLLHLLPVEPLDGGLALHYLLCSRLDGVKAGKISMGISLIFLFPLAVLGFFVLLQTTYNFTLLAMSVYLMLYLVLKRDLAL